MKQYIKNVHTDFDMNKNSTSNFRRVVAYCCMNEVQKALSFSNKQPSVPCNLNGRSLKTHLKVCVIRNRLKSGQNIKDKTSNKVTYKVLQNCPFSIFVSFLKCWIDKALL